ncbi:MAG: HAMP domain-containing sensor histidine kinase [Bacteroidia bacterium]
MRIRNKLTLTYTLIIAIILLFLNFLIYYFTVLNTKQDFYVKLKERAFIAGEVFLEQDELSPKLFQDIKNKFLQSLPNEIVKLYDKNDNPAFIDVSEQGIFTNDKINLARANKLVEYEIDNRQVVGICYDDNQGQFIVMASAVDLPGMERLMYLREELFLGFILSLIIVYLSGRFFSIQALKPMSNIVKEVNAIGASNLHLRVNQGNGKDEIAELAVTFNNMLTRLETAFEVQKDFVSNASHELRTPLTTIIGEIDVSLSKERNEVEYRKVLNSVLSEAERLSKMTNGLLDMAQTGFYNTDLVTEEVRLDDLLWESKSEVEKKIPGVKIHIEYTNMPEDASALIIKGNKQLLHIAFENIFENASKFSDNKIVTGHLEYATDKIRITILDSGIGIPEAEQKKVLDSFYRAENARNYTGSGIGLSLVNRIVQLHQGTLNITSEIGKGTSVELTFNTI